jgi:DNA replication protein DnaC
MTTISEKDNNFDTELREAAHNLFLSSRIDELCRNEATPEQAEFLLYALKEELKAREQTRRQRMLKKANFPVVKGFSGYNYAHITLPSTLNRDNLEDCGFIKDRQNLIMYGPAGTGKTHLAIALGVKACSLGWRVKFETTANLAQKLTDAKHQGTFEQLMKELQKVDLLILDEWGYIPIGCEASELIYSVINDCYERRSIILTTTLEFSKWGYIFSGERLATAMLDRLVHHGQMITFTGHSYRMEHSLMRQNTYAAASRS